ncbi:hypothetical protein PMAC_001759 [Pneumocystis sp. 'macacae']|nr:hypothetical protein PMAC_001759 [Pneumocystis sp. 'macacae']
MSQEIWDQNQMSRRLQEKQAIRQRGAVKHKVKSVPFEILPVPLHSPKLSHVDTQRNKNKSSLIKHSGKKDDHVATHFYTSLALSPSKKMNQHNEKMHEVSPLKSKQVYYKSPVSSFARRTGSPASKPPPRISVGLTPLKEQFLNNNVMNTSIKRPIKNIIPHSNAKHLEKSLAENVHDERILKRQKIHGFPVRDYDNQRDSDKDEYSDTDDNDHDYDYDETKTKVPITVHKFSERGTGSINEVDVVSQVVLGLLKHLRKKTESAYAKKVIHAFEEEVAVKFLEMTDILDNYLILDRAVRKSTRNIARLRNELYTIRKIRNDTAVKMRHLRQSHNDADNESQVLKSIQNFLEDIEILHNKISSNTKYTEKAGTVSLLQTVTPFMTKSWGILEYLSTFNTFLKKIDEALS